MDKFVGVLFGLFMVAACIGLGYAASGWKCSNSWGDSSMPHRMKWFQCQVKHPTMGWVNEERIRATE